METKKMTCGEALAQLGEHYGTNEIRDLARLSGVSRATLDGWSARPASRLNVLGRAAFTRAMAGEAGAVVAPERPTVASLAARVAEIERRLDLLTRINHDAPQRFAKMVRSAKAGGGAF